jgi:hypothetical protein
LCQYHVVFITIALFEVGYYDTSSIAVFAQYFLGYSWSFVFPNILWHRFFNLCDECHWDFDGIALNI